MGRFSSNLRELIVQVHFAEELLPFPFVYGGSISVLYCGVDIAERDWFGQIVKGLVA